MKINKTKHFPNGFTLIELLIVVLIIGILAAVALPQYQFAVVKSRVASYLPLVKSIATTEILYVLSNGESSRDVRKLDITLPSECTISGPWVTCGNDFAIDNSPSEAILNYCPDNTHNAKKCRDTRDFSIRFYHSGYKNNKSECITYNNSKLGTKICNSLHFN